MAVLIEMISIIIKRDSIEKNLPSNQYLTLMDYVLQNPSCMDEDILCIHMNGPILTSNFVDFSKECDLDWGEDFIIVDQNNGPTTNCEWIQFTHIGADEPMAIGVFFDEPKDFGDALYIYLKDKDTFRVAVPQAWKYEGSMSQGHKVIPIEDME